MHVRIDKRKDANVVRFFIIASVHRAFDTRSIVSSTRWIVRHILTDMFFRQGKEISNDLAEPSRRFPSLLPLYILYVAYRAVSFSCSRASFFHVNFSFFLTCSVGRRWRVAVGSRFKWACRIAIARGSPSVSATYDSASSMNNAFSTRNRYADCRSVRRTLSILVSHPQP